MGKYTGDMVAYLAEQGHEIRVVTAPPYYPAWRVERPFRSWTYSIRRQGNITVYRCPLWVPRKPTGLTRILHLLSFAATSLFVVLMQIAWRPKLVWTVEPTLACAPASLVVAKISRAVSWLHIQDLEVDAALGLDVLSTSGTTRFALNVERWIMRRFDLLSSISGWIMDKIRDKGITDDRLRSFPNWVDVDAIKPLDSRSAYADELGIPEGGVVCLYSGNMGKKQGLEILARVARRLQRHTELHFVFCGTGPGFPNLQAACEGLDRVHFLPLQPLQRLSELLGLADIHLLPQRADAADLVMPSKLTGMMASSKAIIATAAAGTELAQVVSSCGVVVEPEQEEPLAAAVERLLADPAERKRLGEKSRAYAEHNLARDAVLARFEKDLKDAVDELQR